MRTETDLYVIEKVKEIRIKQGFTQEALSFALNKTRNFINVREAGPKKYNVEHLNQIAKILKCSARDFLPEKPIYYCWIFHINFNS